MNEEVCIIFAVYIFTLDRGDFSVAAAELNFTQLNVYTLLETKRVSKPIYR